MVLTNYYFIYSNRFKKYFHSCLPACLIAMQTVVRRIREGHGQHRLALNNAHSHRQLVSDVLHASSSLRIPTYLHGDALLATPCQHVLVQRRSDSVSEPCTICAPNLHQQLHSSRNTISVEANAHQARRPGGPLRLRWPYYSSSTSEATRSSCTAMPHVNKLMVLTQCDSGLFVFHSRAVSHLLCFAEMVGNALLYFLSCMYVCTHRTVHRRSAVCPGHFG